MAKTPSIYIDDILSAIRRIETYTKELTRAEFGRDELRQDAVIRCLEIVSEASRRVPDAFKAEYGEIPLGQDRGDRKYPAPRISVCFDGRDLGRHADPSARTSSRGARPEERIRPAKATSARRGPVGPEATMLARASYPGILATAVR